MRGKDSSVTDGPCLATIKLRKMERTDVEKFKAPLTLERSYTSRSSCREVASTQDGEDMPCLHIELGSTLNETRSTLSSAYKCGWCTWFPWG